MEVKEDEKYLMFFLEDEYYGLPILKVNEIIGLMEITTIPKTPDFMKGVINLRGKIIPVMDLRLKFNMPERAYDEQTCIIIVEIPIHGKTQFVGLVVDKVAEVVNILHSDIESPPQYGQDADSGFLTGIGKVKEKVVMLLDIQLIINCHEVINFVMNKSEDIEDTGNTEVIEPTKEVKKDRS